MGTIPARPTHSPREVENELRRQDTTNNDRIKTWTRVVSLYTVGYSSQARLVTAAERVNQRVSSSSRPSVSRAIARFLHGKINTFQDKRVGQEDLLCWFKSETRRMEEFVLAALYQARKGNNRGRDVEILRILVGLIMYLWSLQTVFNVYGEVIERVD